MEPKDHLLYEYLLRHLEAEWPKLLESLLVNGSLDTYLQERVAQEFEAEESLVEQNPGMSIREAREIISPELLFENNPEQDPQNPRKMSRRGQRLLEKFRDSLDE